MWTGLSVGLQRGRACEGAEMRSSNVTSHARRSLQRGRACEGAEMRGAESVAEWSHNRFNGAAPVRARKSVNVSRVVPELSLLQRGRACEGAEIRTG